MSLTSEQSDRLERLQRDFCPASLVVDLYGVDLLRNAALWKRYQSWLLRTRARAFAGAETPERVNRHWLEIFLQRERVVPTHLAAARQGIDRSSFDSVYAGLQAKGLEDLEHDRDDDIVSEAYLRNLSDAFDATRGRVFGDHSDHCQRLHDAIAVDLKFEVSPRLCATAFLLGERRFAYDFDAITLDPTSLGYRVLLDTGKPMSLAPDCCGLVTYVRNEGRLRPLLLAGPEPRQLDPDDRTDLRTRLAEAA